MVSKTLFRAMNDILHSPLQLNTPPKTREGQRGLLKVMAWILDQAEELKMSREAAHTALCMYHTLMNHQCDIASEVSHNPLKWALGALSVAFRMVEIRKPPEEHFSRLSFKWLGDSSEVLKARSEINQSLVVVCTATTPFSTFLDLLNKGNVDDLHPMALLDGCRILDLCLCCSQLVRRKPNQILTAKHVAVSVALLMVLPKYDAYNLILSEFCRSLVPVDTWVLALAAKQVVMRHSDVYVNQKMSLTRQNGNYLGLIEQTCGVFEELISVRNVPKPPPSILKKPKMNLVYVFGRGVITSNKTLNLF